MMNLRDIIDTSGCKRQFIIVVAVFALTGAGLGALVYAGLYHALFAN